MAAVAATTARSLACTASTRPRITRPGFGQQAANSSTRAAIESLKPKLKRTPHHHLPPRKPTCASS